MATYDELTKFETESEIPLPSDIELFREVQEELKEIIPMEQENNDETHDVSSPDVPSTPEVENIGDIEEIEEIGEMLEQAVEPAPEQEEQETKLSKGKKRRISEEQGEQEEQEEQEEQGEQEGGEQKRHKEEETEKTERSFYEFESYDELYEAVKADSVPLDKWKEHYVSRYHDMLDERLLFLFGEKDKVDYLLFMVSDNKEWPFPKGTCLVFFARSLDTYSDDFFMWVKQNYALFKGPKVHNSAFFSNLPFKINNWKTLQRWCQFSDFWRNEKLLDKDYNLYTCFGFNDLKITLNFLNGRYFGYNSYFTDVKKKYEGIFRAVDTLIQKCELETLDQVGEIEQCLLKFQEKLLNDKETVRVLSEGEVRTKFNNNLFIKLWKRCFFLFSSPQEFTKHKQLNKHLASFNEMDFFSCDLWQKTSSQTQLLFFEVVSNEKQWVSSNLSKLYQMFLFFLSMEENDHFCKIATVFVEKDLFKQMKMNYPFRESLLQIEKSLKMTEWILNKATDQHLPNVFWDLDENLFKIVSLILTNRENFSFFSTSCPNHLTYFTAFFVFLRDYISKDVITLLTEDVVVNKKFEEKEFPDHFPCKVITKFLLEFGWLFPKFVVTTDDPFFNWLYVHCNHLVRWNDYSFYSHKLSPGHAVGWLKKRIEGKPLFDLNSDLWDWSRDPKLFSEISEFLTEEDIPHYFDTSKAAQQIAHWDYFGYRDLQSILSLLEKNSFPFSLETQSKLLTIMIQEKRLDLLPKFSFFLSNPRPFLLENETKKVNVYGRKFGTLYELDLSSLKFSLTKHQLRILLAYKCKVNFGYCFEFSFLSSPMPIVLPSSHLTTKERPLLSERPKEVESEGRQCCVM